MRKLFLLPIFLIGTCLVNVSLAYYYYEDSAKEHNVSPLNEFKIIIDEQNNDKFPNSFKVDLSPLESGLSGHFVRAEPVIAKDVYLIDQATGKPYKYEIQSKDHVRICLKLKIYSFFFIANLSVYKIL
jgi:hypothetical protein